MGIKDSNEHVNRKSKSIERIISISILILLLLIGAGILIKQSQYDLAEYGISNKKTNDKISAQSKKIDIVDITPAGFKLYSKTSKYNSSTLYEKINGKAPLYLNSGFIKLLTQRFIHNSDKKKWIEIFFYDMGSVKNAFSVYSRQRRTGAVYSSKYHHSYETENSLIMIAGNYYTEIIGSKKSTIIKKAAQEAAEKIKKQLGPPIEIPELLLITSPYIVKNSEKYYISNAFGIRELKNILSAKYLYQKEKITVYLSGPFKSEALNKIIETYKTFLLKEDGRLKNNTSEIPELLLIDVDGYFDTIFRAGSYMAGVHEADTKKHALEVSIILNKIIIDNLGKYNP